MHPFEKQVLAFCRAHQLISPESTVLVGVSGGPDSMALLHALAALRPALGCRLHAAHVDHGLRPRETPAEERLVAGICRDLEIPLAVERVATQEVARRRRLSLEEAARVLRYRFFEAAARECGAGRIAVAHTADDQAEEVLIRLLRGAGRGGLSGMRPRRENGVVRPLLGLWRRDVLAYLAAGDTPYCLDSSNMDRRFLRNRVRHDLLAELRAYNPAISATLCRTAEVLAAEDDLLARLTAEALAAVAEIGEKNGCPVVEVDGGAFGALDLALRRRVAEQIFCLLGEKPTFARIDAVLRLAAIPSGERHFHNGLRVRKASGRLIFRYPRGRGRVRGRLADKE